MSILRNGHVTVSNEGVKSPTHFHNEYILKTLFYSLRQRYNKNFVYSLLLLYRESSRGGKNGKLYETIEVSVLWSSECVVVYEACEAHIMTIIF